MRYIIIKKSDLPALDPIHANPHAKEWCIEDTQEGHIATTFHSEAAAHCAAREWNEDEDEANA